MILLNFEELNKKRDGDVSPKSYSNVLEGTDDYGDVDDEKEISNFKKTRTDEKLEDFGKVEKGFVGNQNERDFFGSKDGARSDDRKVGLPLDEFQQRTQHQRYEEVMNHHKEFKQQNKKNINNHYHKNRPVSRVAEGGGGAINSLMRMLKGGEYAKHIFSSNKNKIVKKKIKKSKKKKKKKKIGFSRNEIVIEKNSSKKQQHQEQFSQHQQQQRCIVPQLDPFNPEAQPFISYNYVGQKCPIHQVGTLKEGGVLSVNLKDVQSAGYMYIKRVDDERNVFPKYFPLTDNNLATKG